MDTDELNKPNKQPFIILSGISCNTACIMCEIRAQRPDQLNATTEQIMKDIVRGRKEGHERIEISGGEPTIRKDILFLIRQSKKLGYKKIGISTNGILMHDKGFCEKLVKAGLTNITFSMVAHNKKLHETINRVPGSFDKTIAGIKNAVSHKNLEITATTVIFNVNFKYIFQIGKLIRTLGIPFWKISELLPNFLPKEKYTSLCITRHETIEVLRRLKLLLNDFQFITFYGFTPCSLPQDVLQIEKFRWVTSHEFFNIGKFIRYTGRNIAPENLKKMDICEDCIYSKECAGIWVKYLDYFGDKEIRELAIKHGCIKNNYPWLIVN